MTVAILHHVGDANEPPVRVPSTIALAQKHPGAKVLVADRGPEYHALCGAPVWRVIALPVAEDTVGEVVASLRAAYALQVTTLYISTEPGHVGRAAMIARILYWRRGVRIVPHPSAPGTYRSPWLRTVRDACRAAWIRLSGRGW